MQPLPIDYAAGRPAPSLASHLLVVALWLAVGLPAAWGVYRTAVNSALLFRAAPATSTATAPTVTR